MPAKSEVPNLPQDICFTPEVILDGLGDGVYVCDRERRIVYWNKGAERITGWSAADVVGRKCLEDVLCQVDKDGRRLCGEEFCPLHRSIVTGAATRLPLIVFALCKNGKRLATQVTAAPLRNAAGEIVGGVETFRDVSAMLTDLERARKIQTQTLELDLPPDPRLRFSTLFLPHDIVGGDFYSVRQLDADNYGFMLADMEGHGVAAALYTMQLSVLWSRYLGQLRNPTRFASTLNRELTRIFGTVTTFATTVCGVIDARSGNMRFVGAGAPASLLIHPDGAIEKLKSAGPPLGVVEDVPYIEQNAQLNPGDAILFLSDGALEIENAEGKWLGVDGFADVLTRLEYPQAELNLDALIEELLKFSNDIRLKDDVTIIEGLYYG